PPRLDRSDFDRELDRLARGAAGGGAGLSGLLAAAGDGEREGERNEQGAAGRRHGCGISWAGAGDCGAGVGSPSGQAPTARSTASRVTARRKPWRAVSASASNCETAASACSSAVASPAR